MADPLIPLMSLAVRRVVTGHTMDGVSKVIFDGEIPSKPVTIRADSATNRITHLWRTSEMPCDIAMGEHIPDVRHDITSLMPPTSGSQFGILEFSAHAASIAHRTDTLDYVVILSGELDLVLDDETVRLKAGDVVVQRGTIHRWVNPSAIPARMAFVLVDATPLHIGSPLH